MSRVPLAGTFTGLVVADYPFLGIVWSLLALFAFAMWLCLLFMVWSDVFRRPDISGAAKVVWLLLTLLFPFVGLFVYLITQNKGMVERIHTSFWRPRLP
jgi:Phospholipase_D-nuclease N-terminal